MLDGQQIIDIVKSRIASEIGNLVIATIEAQATRDIVSKQLQEALARESSASSSDTQNKPDR